MIDAPLHRKGWEQKLEAQFKKYKLSGGSYNKNDEKLFAYLNSLGRGDEIIRKAIKNGERRMARFSKEDRPSAYNPGTTVHKLVEKLISFTK